MFSLKAFKCYLFHTNHVELSVLMHHTFCTNEKKNKKRIYSSLLVLVILNKLLLYLSTHVSRMLYANISPYFRNKSNCILEVIIQIADCNFATEDRERGFQFFKCNMSNMVNGPFSEIEFLSGSPQFLELVQVNSQITISQYYIL